MSNPNTVECWDGRYSTAGRGTPEGAIAALPSHRPLYDAVVGAMRFGAGEIDILDVGAGVGQVAHLFVQRYGLPKIGRYTGLDFSPVAHGAFMDAFGRYGNMDFICDEITEGFLTELGCQRGGFDLIVCAEVLEHLTDDTGAARGIRKALRPGGRAVVSVPAKPGIRLHLRHYDEQGMVERIGAAMAPCKQKIERISDRWLLAVFDL